MTVNGLDINKSHVGDDVDVNAFAHHHTLGTGANQASPGNHTHDGKTSKPIAGGGGGGTDEVAIQTNTPSGSIELWVDLDDSPPGSMLSGPVTNLPNGSNLNTIIDSGFYDVSGPVNAPGSINNWVYLEVYRHSNQANVYVLQILSSLTGNSQQQWMRRCTNNTWNPWICIAGPDGNIWMQQCGQENVTAGGSTTSVSKSMTFPSPFGITVPNLQLSVYGSTSVLATANTISTTGCNIVIFMFDHSNIPAGTYSVFWLASQPTYNSNLGPG
jgi:hypothetical protein